MMADDEECSRTAEAREPEAKNIGEGKIAGHRVVRYRFIDEQGRNPVESGAWLGLRGYGEVRLFNGTLGIPGAKWRYMSLHTRLVSLTETYFSYRPDTL